jgi:hypothetical protein
LKQKEAFDISDDLRNSVKMSANDIATKNGLKQAINTARAIKRPLTMKLPPELEGIRAIK